MFFFVETKDHKRSRCIDVLNRLYKMDRELEQFRNRKELWNAEFSMDLRKGSDVIGAHYLLREFVANSELRRFRVRFACHFLSISCGHLGLSRFVKPANGVWESINFLDDFSIHTKPSRANVNAVTTTF